MFKSRKQKETQILASQKAVKDTEFDFERIALYFLNCEKKECFQVLKDETLNDLDFEELFMYLDRTSSKIGQQYLYHSLRTIPNGPKRLEQQELLIDQLQSDVSLSNTAILEVNKLNGESSYFIQRLIFGDAIDKPKWFWIIPILCLLSSVSFLTMFFYPVFTLVFLGFLLLNGIIHYWNKNNILTYANTIPQLIKMNQVHKELMRFNVIANDHEKNQESSAELDKLTRLAVFFKWEAKLSSEFGQLADLFLELLKGAFLIETILFFRLTNRLAKQKEAILQVFMTVAKVDVALSISTFRNSLPYYTKPNISKKSKRLDSTDLYHPLTVNPVSNSIITENDKSILISGSNMSGKTTFIRTIGINVLLGQTINTCCAKSFEFPKIAIHSAVRISDDLVNDTSYYYQEVKTIKQMIDRSLEGSANLFLLDELFKGTNTTERIASGKAVLSALNSGPNIVFASTHDLELTEFLSTEYSYYHFTEHVENDMLTFDYKLKPGKLIKTNAIKILEINGFPKSVTDEARALSKQMTQMKQDQTKVD